MSVSWIRFLVENYYDLQKLRVETFNRLVAYVKSNPDKFSQFFPETQKKCASLKEGGNQSDRASQAVYEDHKKIASPAQHEIQRDVASLTNSEAQSQRARARGRYAAIAKQLVKAQIECPREIEDLMWYHNKLYETEKQLVKRLDQWSKGHPLRSKYLSKIRGIGPILSAGLIAWLSPISRFPNISKLWAYCGLAPGQKRRKGKKLNYNPRLKTFMWKVGASFEKQNAERSQYRRLYVEVKEKYLHREDLAKAIEDGVKGARLHVRMMAMKYVEKRFLADLWLTWRRMEGLPVTEPYAIRILKHDGFEEPQVDDVEEPGVD